MKDPITKLATNQAMSAEEAHRQTVHELAFESLKLIYQSNALMDLVNKGAITEDEYSARIIAYVKSEALARQS